MWKSRTITITLLSGLMLTACCVSMAGCGGCHALAAAGAAGTIGPDLDDAKPSVDLAIERVTNGKGQMPSFKDRLSEAQIQAVAQFVAENAGK